MTKIVRNYRIACALLDVSPGAQADAAEAAYHAKVGALLAEGRPGTLSTVEHAAGLDSALKLVLDGSSGYCRRLEEKRRRRVALLMDASSFLAALIIAVSMNFA